MYSIITTIPPDRYNIVDNARIGSMEPMIYVMQWLVFIILIVAPALLVAAVWLISQHRDDDL